MRAVFKATLKGAQRDLRAATTPVAAYIAIAEILHALKAMTLKASGNIPPQYRE